MKRNDQGLAVIEVIIVIVLVGAIGFVSYSAWQNLQKPAASKGMAAKIDATPAQAGASASKLSSPAPTTPSPVPSATPKAPRQAAGTPLPATYYKPTSSIAAQINASEYQEVDLFSGMRYFGNLQQVQPGQLRLSSVFVLIVSPAGTQMSLKKSTPDPLTFNVADVSLWANLPPDDMFARAITSYLQLNP